MITQGNWIAGIEESGIDVSVEKTGFGVVWIGTEKELKDCEYPLSEAKSNAKLISAAPDMYEALGAFISNVDNWLKTGEPADPQTSKAIYEKAKKAMLKAVGI